MEAEMDDVLKLIGDNQNFLAIIKSLVKQSNQEEVTIPLDILETSTEHGLRIEPVFESEDDEKPKEIKLMLVSPDEREDIESSMQEGL